MDYTSSKSRVVKAYLYKSSVFHVSEADLVKKPLDKHLIPSANYIHNIQIGNILKYTLI